MSIDLLELERITNFLQVRSVAGSARDITSWCEARDVDGDDVRLYARSLTRSALAMIAAAEEVAGEGEELPPHLVECAIATAIATGFQVGLDSERRRRDGRELPS